MIPAIPLEISQSTCAQSSSKHWGFSTKKGRMYKGQNKTVLSLAGTIYRGCDSPPEGLQIGWNRWRHTPKHVEYGSTTVFLCLKISFTLIFVHFNQHFFYMYGLISCPSVICMLRGWSLPVASCEPVENSAKGSGATLVDYLNVIQADHCSLSRILSKCSHKEQQSCPNLPTSLYSSSESQIQIKSQGLPYTYSLVQNFTKSCQAKVPEPTLCAKGKNSSIFGKQVRIWESLTSLGQIE